MANEVVCAKPPIKGELLLRMSERYPDLDIGTIEIVSHIQAIARALTARLNRDLASSGLTEGKFYVLVYLYSEEMLGHDTPSPSDIADNLGVTRGTITGLLDGLEREDYVARHHDSHDRRALTIEMTDRSRTFMDHFLQTGVADLGEAIPLPAEERRTMTDWLKKIEAALREPASD